MPQYMTPGILHARTTQVRTHAIKHGCSLAHRITLYRNPAHQSKADAVNELFGQFFQSWAEHRKRKVLFIDVNDGLVLLGHFFGRSFNVSNLGIV